MVMVKRGSLADLMHVRPDHDVVRMWLAERGLVAVDRKLMDEVAALENGNPFNVYYEVSNDRYLKRVS